MFETNIINYQDLKTAVAGSAAAFRLSQKLEAVSQHRKP
jgi:hypothetical protein